MVNSNGYGIVRTDLVETHVQFRRTRLSHHLCQFHALVLLYIQDTDVIRDSLVHRAGKGLVLYPLRSMVRSYFHLQSVESCLCPYLRPKRVIARGRVE